MGFLYMTQSDELPPHLTALVGDLSDGELSVLRQALETEGNGEPIHLATATGSANDRLWSELARLGRMVEVVPNDLPAGSKLFTLVPDANKRVQALVASAGRQRIADLFNRLCREIPPLIATPVISADGTPSDVVMMLAGIVEATMRRFIKPNLHEEFLTAVADRAQDLRRHHQSRLEGASYSASPGQS